MNNHTKIDSENELHVLIENQPARHETRKALAINTVGLNTSGAIDSILGYVGNKVLEGLNSAYENFKRYNINLLQVTNATDYYMGALAFRSHALEEQAKVNVIAPLPVLIIKGTTVDAVYEKGLLDSTKSGTAFQWIELSSQDGQTHYTLKLIMYLVSVGSSESPSMEIEVYKGQEKLDTYSIKPGDMTGIHPINGSPFSVAAEVTIGSSVLTLIQHQ